MTFKALVSPIALATALAFTGGAAFAQADTMAPAMGDMTMIGEQTVSPDDVGQVTTFCRDLATQEQQGSDTIDAEEEAADEQGIADVTSVINFETITLTQCEEGGFLSETEALGGSLTDSGVTAEDPDSDEPEDTDASTTEPVEEESEEPAAQ